ncbi:MAG: hypothetical protein KGL39_24160 [Patescibacteria group bacterium]|nr:hypothetical protein [Patescibacteria group bacterium]
MPYPGTTFRKHNKKLSDGAARKAGAQAEAMERAGVTEGEAIATANKTGDRMMRNKTKPHPKFKGRRK